MATNEVSKFIAPDGNTYHYKDEQARNDILSFNNNCLLLCSSIIGTTQIINFLNGKPNKVLHNNSEGTSIRIDDIYYDKNIIKEIRTLNTGESITIISNLENYTTEVK